MSTCVNQGGASSLIRLASLPHLEQETEIAASSLPSLDVWGARPGEVFTALAPDQSVYRVRLTSKSAAEARGIPFELLRHSPESSLQIEVYQALPDKERFETVLQKLTELGVTRVVPMQTEHSLTLAERDAPQKKSHRWPDVLRRAARQCRRAMLPELFDVVPFEEALEMAGRAELSLMLYEGDTGWSMQEGIGSFQPQSVALMVGPEGGFSSAERDVAQNAGVLPVSLGPRILRTETAAIVGAAILQNRIGDLR
jgi:16S rRNA (uracil1498-N3)-methyltransferase